MKANNIVPAICEQIENNHDLFDNNSKKIVLIEAVPGAGKTTNTILQTLKRFYGEYITANKEQIYTKEFETVIIPAGSGNKATEDEELFNLKTQNGKDCSFLNIDKRTLVVTFDGKIAKEITKKTDKIVIHSSENAKLTSINVSTSHSLLFGLSTSLGLFDISEKNAIAQNYAKGDFTLKDVSTILQHFYNSLIENPKTLNFKKDIDTILNDKNSLYSFSLIMHAVTLLYYNNPFMINNNKDILELIKATDSYFLNKGESDFDLKKKISSYFSSETLSLFEGKKNKELSFIVFFIKKYMEAMNNAIKNGLVEVGHAYYYKHAHIACMQNKNNLLKLFGENNSENALYDNIFIDEAQDLTPIMIDLLIRYFYLTMENNLQVSIVAVGDSLQAIYGFAQRQNAFDVFKKALSSNHICSFYMNYTFRLPIDACNFVNNLVSAFDDGKKNMQPVFQDKIGFVADEHLPLEKISYFFLTGVDKDQDYHIDSKNKMLVLGRTNIEVVIAFVKTYVYLKEIAPDMLKFLSIDANAKKIFKNIVKKGINALDNEKIKLKIQNLTNLQNPKLSDINNANIKNDLPLYLQQALELYDYFSEEIIEEALLHRASPKSSISFMTAHSAKGKEAKAAYILDGINFCKQSQDDSNLLEAAYQEIIKEEGGPSYKGNDEKETYQELNLQKIDKDEFKIAYVSLTRAPYIFLDKNMHKALNTFIDNKHIEVLNVFKQDFDCFCELPIEKSSNKTKIDKKEQKNLLSF